MSKKLNGTVVVVCAMISGLMTAQPAAGGGSAPNDLCQNAIELMVPDSISGTTVGATFDDVGFCGTSNETAGVWYLVIGTGTTITATTCNFADYDTKISVFCGDCEELICITGIDDSSCGGSFTLKSTVSWCSQAGAEYLILVHGFFGSIGNFTLTVFANDTPCQPLVECQVEAVSPPNDDCRNALPVGLGETEFSNEGANSDGPSPCNGLEADVWFEFTAPFTGEIDISSCDWSDFDVVIAVYDNCGCPANTYNLLACSNGCPKGDDLEIDVCFGQCYKIQVGGSWGDQGSAVLTIRDESENECGDEDEELGNCFNAHGPCQPFCNDKKCCTLICTVDPFCCNNTWDQQCVDQALDLCGNCGDPGAGNCFVGHGGGGCNDAACCQAVCSVDAYCCHVQWDTVCADEAEALCGGPPIPCPGAGACRFPHPNPGCEDQACCELICSIDAFCCAEEWDQLCANQAIELCPNIGACPGNGDCFAAHTNPGCEDESCCQIVCDEDPFCCGVEWDQACADEATELCQGSCPGKHDCFQAHGTPSCDDFECCKKVCFEDIFCCAVQWDKECVIAAGLICTECCDGDETPEGEPCGSDTNGGCNSTPPIYGSISCGEAICGNAWAEFGTRDTDWYLLTLEYGCHMVTANLRSNFQGVVFLVGGINVCVPTILGTGSSVECKKLQEAEAPLEPGTYAVFVAPASFDGTPCNSGENDYRVQLSCDLLPPAAGCDIATCPGDVDRTGQVNVGDLMTVIADYGCVVPPGPCLGDANEDRVSNVDDVITVLTNWGTCQ